GVKPGREGGVAKKAGCGAAPCHSATSRPAAPGALETSTSPSPASASRGHDTRAAPHIEVGGRKADAADAKGRNEKRLASAEIFKKPSEIRGVSHLADARTQESLL